MGPEAYLSFLANWMAEITGKTWSFKEPVPKPGRTFKGTTSTFTYIRKHTDSQCSSWSTVTFCTNWSLKMLFKFHVERTAVVQMRDHKGMSDYLQPSPPDTQPKDFTKALLARNLISGRTPRLCTRSVHSHFLKKINMGNRFRK